MENKRLCNSRIALRLPRDQKKKLEKLKLKRKEKSTSQLISEILEESLGETDNASE
jgi:hypothetical protein